MMNRFFVINFIYSLNPISARRYALKMGIDFSDEEISMLLPYIKNNIALLTTSMIPTQKIHADLDSRINMNSIDKLCLLVKKLGYN